MTLEEAITAALNPLVNGEVYWDETPDGYAVQDSGVIILHSAGGKAEQYVDETRPEMSLFRVQMEYWAKRRADANELAKAGLQACKDAGLSLIPYGHPIGDSNSAMGISGARQDVGFWYNQ